MRLVAPFVWLAVLFWGTVGLAYEGGAVEGGGTIQGTVRLEGSVAALAPRQVVKHREVCGDQVPDEALVVGRDNSLRYAVVSIEGITRGKKLEEDAINTLDNQRCRFVPHVLTAGVGQWLLLSNSDPILHNADAVKVADRKTLFNVALPPNKQLRQPLTVPGIIRVNCEIRHTWMEAYVVVADHPYITVTDAEGAFELRDVPPGSYTLKVWHERLGSIEKPVTISKDGKHVQDFVFPKQK